MRAPFSFWKSSGFDPGTLGPDEWFRGYQGVPWLPTPSTGASGANGNFLVNGVAPASVLVGGKPAARFNGATTGLISAADSTAFVGGTVPAGGNFDPLTAVVAFIMDVAEPEAYPGAPTYQYSALIGDSGSHWSLVANALGVQVGAWGGGDSTTPTIALATGVPAMAVFRWDGAAQIMKCRVSQAGGTLEQQVARVAGAGIQRLGKMIMGVNYANNRFFNGRVVEALGWGHRLLTDVEIAKLGVYFNATYGWGLT